MNRDRGFRRQQRDRIVKNRQKEIKELPVTISEKDMAHPGTMAKKHPLDCGKPGCHVCHLEKAHPKGEEQKKNKIRIRIEEEVDDSKGPPELDGVNGIMSPELDGLIGNDGKIKKD